MTETNTDILRAPVFEEDANAGLRCSFCRKTKEDARLLIASACGSFICDACVELCAKIVAEQLPFGGRWGAKCRGEESSEQKIARARCHVRMVGARYREEQREQEARRAAWDAAHPYVETADDASRAGEEKA